MKAGDYKRYIPYLVIMAGLIFFYYYRYRRVPDMEFSSLQVTQQDGTKVPLGNILGEKTVIHFYASWCGPCIREMKEIKEEWAHLESENIQFIFITDDPEDRIAPFRIQMPQDVLFLQIPSLQDAGIYTIPTSYFLKNKTITTKHVDPMSWKNLQEINEQFNQ